MVNEITLKSETGSTNMSTSIGLSTFSVESSSEATAQSLMARDDKALYGAKRAGKNQI